MGSHKKGRSVRASSLRPGSDLMELTCNRCGTRLVPAMSGFRCPRLAACGYGGLVERVGSRAVPVR